MQAKIEGDKLTITLPLVRQPSKTGKTMLVATTNGNRVSTVIVDGKPVTVGVNAWIAK